MPHFQGYFGVTQEPVPKMVVYANPSTCGGGVIYQRADKTIRPALGCIIFNEAHHGEIEGLPFGKGHGEGFTSPSATLSMM